MQRRAGRCQSRLLIYHFFVLRVSTCLLLLIHKPSDFSELILGRLLRAYYHRCSQLWGCESGPNPRCLCLAI